MNLVIADAPCIFSGSSSSPKSKSIGCFKQKGKCAASHPGREAVRYSLDGIVEPPSHIKAAGAAELLFDLQQACLTLNHCG